MADLAQMLREAPCFEDRKHILHDDISSKKESFQEENKGLVLDIEEHLGLKVGDKVKYTNNQGQERTGYLSHFFMRMFTIYGDVYFMASTDGPTLDTDKGILPVIFDSQGIGYSFHHGKALPQRLDE